MTLPFRSFDSHSEKRPTRTIVSTKDCSDVADFRAAIKTQFPKQLNGYEANELVLLQPDGTTEIDPRGDKTIAKLNEFKVGPWTPLVVTDCPYQLLVAVLKNS